MINKALLDINVQDFIDKNIHTDIQKLVLKKSPFGGISSKELAEQIQSKKSIQKKLPTWFQQSGLIFPPKINAEQASSEPTAAYKSSLILDGELIDLTGGFGVDDFYFAKKAKKVIHCERNEFLSAIVAHNAHILNCTNISFYTGNSEDYLKSIKKTDTIFVDPSRRDSSGRTFLFEDCEPDILKNLPVYLQKSKKIIIKAAPMLDISAAITALKNVTEIHVVSLNNECKELLFVIDVNTKSSTKIYCALLGGNLPKVYGFEYGKEKELENETGKLSNYIYEPDAAFLKAGLFKSIATYFDIKKLHQHTHIYTSAILLDDFPGRKLKVLSAIDFKTFSEKNRIKKPTSLPEISISNLMN